MRYQGKHEFGNTPICREMNCKVMRVTIPAAALFLIQCLIWAMN